MKISRASTDWLLLAGFCGFLFFFGLAYFGLIGADEPRYAQVAREMLARHDWITPTLGGKPWLEKPPLYYWQAMLAYSIFGVSDWAARLPSAVDATLMVFAVYLFLKSLRPGFQLDGALMTASAAGVIGFARAASTDMPLAAMFTIALLGWYAWYESESYRDLTIFYGFLALGALAKGPVAPLLAAVIIALFATAKHDFRLLLRTLWIPGILLFCAISLPWYVAVQIRNPEFLRVFILEHNLARFGTNLYHHPEPFWYFIPVTLIGLIPWTVCVVASAAESVRVWWTERQQMLASEDALNVFLMIWLVVPVVFFSLSKSKLPGYIVPALPAGTLLLAEYLRRRSISERKPGYSFNCFALDCRCDADCAGSHDSVHHPSASSSLGQSSRDLVCICRSAGYRHCCHAIYEARLCRIAFYHLGAGRVVSSRVSASRTTGARQHALGSAVGK